MAIKITKYDRRLRELLKLKRQVNGNIQCSRCHKLYPFEDCSQVHVSHFFSRANWTTRLDEDNVDFHCYGCHAYFEGNPHDHACWKREQLGERKYDHLVLRAKSTIPDVYGMRKKEYLKQWYEDTKEEIEDLNSDIVTKLRRAGM